MGDTVLAQTGTVGFGPQTAKGAIATTFYRYKTVRSSLGAIEDNRTAQLEIGGTPYPTGAYKAGSFYGGEAVLQPRLEGDIGWLLYAACGAVSTLSDVPEAGLYTHIFRPDPAATSVIKWLSAHVITPGAAAANAEDLGTIGLDCRVPQLRIVVPQNDVIAAMLTLLGRVPSWDIDPSWSWENAYEDFDSVPISSVSGGYFELPDGTEIPALGVDVALSNVTTQPQREMIVGEYHPDDLAVVTRNLIISFIHKYPNPDLYLDSLANGASGHAIAWSPVVNTQDCELRVESPANIPSKTFPYSLSITAQKVSWAPDGPPVMTAGDMLQVRYVGTVLEPASGDYFRFTIVNEVNGYLWPA